jgi:hypothetical protein
MYLKKKERERERERGGHIHRETKRCIKTIIKQTQNNKKISI